MNFTALTKEIPEILALDVWVDNLILQYLKQNIFQKIYLLQNEIPNTFQKEKIT